MLRLNSLPSANCCPSGGASGALRHANPVRHYRAFGDVGQRHQHCAAARSVPSGQDYVISLGEALFDCLADQLGLPKEQVQSWTPYPGGAPANVACALAQLGVPAVFFGALGDDQLGRQMLELLQERGVDCSAIQIIDKPTRDVLVTRSLTGDREFAGFGKAQTTEYADCFFEASKMPTDKIKGASALITGTLGLAYPVAAEAMQQAVAAAKGAGGRCMVVIDVNWRPVFWQDEKVARGVINEYLQSADILKFSDVEVEWLLGMSADTALQAPEKVLELWPNARGVLISAGEKGSSYAFGGVAGKMDASGFVPVFDVDVVDTTGAGDAYLAGFVYKMLTVGTSELLSSPEALRDALYFASACGAFTTQGAGAIAAQPTLQQVEQLVRQTLGSTAA